MSIRFTCRECEALITVADNFATVLRAFGMFPWACPYCHNEYQIYYDKVKGWVALNTHREEKVN